MNVKLKTIGILTVLTIFFAIPNVVAKTYNPLIDSWIEEVDLTLESLQTNTDDEDDEDEETEQECSKVDWTSFSKSFLSYDNFIGDWSDIIDRNDCLREDIWFLEDKLKDINKFGILEAKKCNENIILIQETYKNLNFHIDGLRRYGEDSELEDNESEDCPNCKKAEIVGKNNVKTNYNSPIYTEIGCELTREKSKKWSEEFEKLKKSLNLFKNIKSLWKDGISGESLEFTADDYSAAQKNADGWWGKTWDSFYGYKGRQLSFRHLRDGEDSLVGTTRIGELGKSAAQAMATVLLPPTFEEITETYTLQLEVYQSISYNKEQVILDEDLADWKSKLDSKYKISDNAEDDLENYLINLDNSIKVIIDKKNPIILQYYKKLKYTADHHCKNLYGSCKE